MKRNRRIKILATLGPASDTEEMIEKLNIAGADAFRINMSHTSHEKLNELYTAVRNVEAKTGFPIGILVDLQGPKLRIDTFADGKVELKKGQSFQLDSNPEPGDATRVYLPHPEILSSVEAGHKLLLDDGRIILEATKVENNVITTKVLNNCVISNRKGVSLPDTLLPVTAMTPKDDADLEAALKLDIDFIALSFVQRASDVDEVQAIVGNKAKVVAKIEKPAAVADIDQIIASSDAIMVARGDLGVELPIQQLPGIQKLLTRAARTAGKPVIVATQMLESMIESPMPTRAEVSDVATAVYDGADAVMLSAESAAGDYPIEAVQMMSNIAHEAESDPIYGDILHATITEADSTSADAISAAVYAVAETLNLAAIVCYTESGATAARVSRERPKNRILTLTPSLSTARNLALTWGVYSVTVETFDSEDDMIGHACETAYKHDLVKFGDHVVITAGIPYGRPGTTNMLRIAAIGKNGKCAD